MAQTLEDVRKAFDSSGITVSDWAAARGFRRENVYAVLSGRTKGRRGQAHRIAKALGLKSRSDLAEKLGLQQSPSGSQVRPAQAEEPPMS